MTASVRYLWLGFLAAVIIFADFVIKRSFAISGKCSKHLGRQSYQSLAECHVTDYDRRSELCEKLNEKKSK